MTTALAPPRPGSHVDVPIWGWALMVISLALAYLALQENGWLLANNWETVHEFFHDGRHALGFPCH